MDWLDPRLFVLVLGIALLMVGLLTMPEGEEW